MIRSACQSRLKGEKHMDERKGRIGMNKVIIAVCVVCALCTAVPAYARQKELRYQDLTKLDMNMEGRPVPFFRYKGNLLRLISTAELQKTTFNKKRVCLEVKFKKLDDKKLQVYNSDALLRIETKLKILKELISGDNIWVVGEVRRFPNKERCYLVVENILKMKPDSELFEERFKNYVAKKQWRRLLNLGKWIGELGEQSAHGVTFKNYDKYNAMKKKAYRKGLAIAETSVPPNDMEGYYEIGVNYLTLLSEKNKAYKMFMKVVTQKPSHKGAVSKLRSLGYVRYKGKWMTVKEKEQKEGEERIAKELARMAAEKKAQEDAAKKNPDNPATKKPAFAKLNAQERLSVLIHLATRPTSEPETDEMKKTRKNLFALIMDEKEARTSIKQIWLLANMNTKLSTKAIGWLSSSAASHEVRKDAANALAKKDNTMALSFLKEAVYKAEASAMRLHFIGAIGNMKEKGLSIPAFIEFLGALPVIDKKAAKKALESLKKITGNNFNSQEEWRAWWQMNEAGYK